MDEKARRTRRDIQVYSPMASDRVTRAANRTAHPGLPDVDEEVLARSIPKPRKTKAQIQQEKVADQTRKADAEKDAKARVAAKVSGIKEIARLENRMSIDAAQVNKNASNPPVLLSIKISRQKSRCSLLHNHNPC